MVTSESRLDLREVVRLFDHTATLAASVGGMDECMERALDLVCDFTGWPLGHVYLFDPDTTALQPTDIWHADDVQRVLPFVQATSRTPLSAGAGLPGRALATGQTLWIPDLSEDPRAPTAFACGIRAGLASPIVGPQRIEGVLEFFAPWTARPEDPLLAVLSHIGLELGSALERARLRDEIRASRARLADAERLGRMGTWRYHVDRDVFHWSEELCALYGLDPATTPTTLDRYLSHVHPDDIDRVRREILRGIETQQGFDVEFRFLLPPDEVRWAHARGEILPPARAGNAPMLVGYCQDVTEQKATLEAIQHGREQLAEAQRLAHLGSWSWNVVTNSVTCSDEMFRMVGIDPAGPPPTLETYFDRVHPEDQGRLQADIRNTVATCQPFDHEFRVVRANGEQRWVHAHGEVVEQADGMATRVAGFTQDITERRLAEEERTRLERMLQQSQRLESLGQLAGGVAHDFNNLLFAILNYAAFVGEELASMARTSADPRYQELLADVLQINRAAERAAELTRRLLAFGRREVARPVVLLLNDVVRDVEQFLRRALGAHIELQTSLQPELWAVRADPGQLEQVLVNLAVNARDAMPGGGKLTVETGNVQIDAESAPVWPAVRPGRYVSLRCSDTGKGMTEQVAERAFEPFFTTKRNGEGSGLGLAMVHGIIAQAGGDVRIDSEPGAGTVITAVWPAVEQASVRASSAPASQVDRRATRQVVLVVEDEAALRDATRRMLVRNGYTVLTAAGGSEAVELTKIHDGPIDLLLTDIIMPHMLGSEVAEAIVAVRPGVQVIYMSGYARSSLTANGSLQPGVLLLEKPFSENELVRLVRRVLEGPPRGVVQSSPS